MEIDRGGVKTSFAVNDLSDEEHARLCNELMLDERTSAVCLALGNTGLNAVNLPNKAPTPTTLEIKSTIESQIGGGSYRAYTTVLDQLNQGKKNYEWVNALSREKLRSELSEWMTDDKLQYVEQSIEKDPNLQFTLVITPNVKVTTNRIIQLAEKFGKGQPLSTTVNHDLLKKYKADELSGYDPSLDSLVRFKLYPSKLNSDFSGTVAEQKSKLASAQIEHPFLCVPSILDDVCHLQTLREDDVKLVGDEAFKRTNTRHFDLESRLLLDWLNVPDSYVGVNGKLYLINSISEDHLGARVLVG